MESLRKRHRLEGEGEQPVAPPALGVRSNNQEGSSRSSGPVLPHAPPPAPPPLAQRSLEHETEMTDATVEQQGESKRRREHPEVPQVTDSSSSESSTDTEMGLVDVCAILCVNSEEEGRREGGPTLLDLAKWDFNKADCPDQMLKIERKFEPLFLIGSPIDSGGGDKEQTRVVLHLAFICELYEIQVPEGRYFLHTHTHIPQTAGISQLCWIS